MLGLIAHFPSFFLDHYIPSLFVSYKYNHVRKFRLSSLFRSFFTCIPVIHVLIRVLLVGAFIEASSLFIINHHGFSPVHDPLLTSAGYLLIICQLLSCLLSSPMIVRRDDEKNCHSHRLSNECINCQMLLRVACSCQNIDKVKFKTLCKRPPPAV